MHTKLHRWAVAEPGRRVDDLANLVYDPAFLTVAWDRVRAMPVREPPESTGSHRDRSVNARRNC
jgi:hypothetical protein